MSYDLTSEQQRAVSFGVAGENLKVEAFAGAGKTSTLVAMAEAMPRGRKGLYLAFNKAIADEAANRFPVGVECRTAHSIAFRAKGHLFKNRLQKINGKVIAELFEFRRDIGGLNPALAGGAILETVNRFTQSVDQEIAPRHFPVERFAGADGVKVAAVAAELFPYATKLWKMMADEDGKTPITHDVYLKLWALERPTLGAQYILFDEAQDANPAMMGLVNRQRAQQIWVGDRYQAIYGWRNAVNAMSKLRIERVCAITQSFRFGQPIADMANLILNKHLNAEVNIRGFDRVESRIAECPQAKTVLCRTNAGAIDQIADAKKHGKRVAVVGGTQELVSLLFGALDLQKGRKPQVPELALFKDWDEVKEYAAGKGDGDLNLLVNQVKLRSPSELIDLLQSCKDQPEKSADLVVSTAHKAKGREWPAVRLTDDFRGPDHAQYNPEETHLLYVAATRARNVLDVSKCGVIQELLGNKAKPQEDHAKKQQYIVRRQGQTVATGTVRPGKSFAP